MPRFLHFRTLVSLLLAGWLLPAAASGETVSRLSSRFLARGEKATLEISHTGSQPAAYPVIPTVPGIKIVPAVRGWQKRFIPGRRFEYIVECELSCYDIGTHVLPSIEVKAGNAATRTEPLEFTIFNPDELKWSEVIVGNTRIPYASAFRVMNPPPYEGETVPVEIKVYVPYELHVADWGIPSFERDGLTAWRFQPSSMLGKATLLGRSFKSEAYPSTLTPTRTGKVGIGPADIRLIITRSEMDGIQRNIYSELNLNVPALELESMPLPESAPEGFENAVGNFSLEVRAGVTEVQEGDPIPVEIEVRGTGNLDTLRPPMPEDSSGWKFYDASAVQRDDERRELSGTTVFHQFLRPLELKSALPSFRLVFFDPHQKAYRTVTSAPIPLQMTPAPLRPVDSVPPPQAMEVPVERMTDILGLLTPSAPTITTASKLPSWTGHAIGALLALGLIARAFWMRHGHRFHKDPEQQARLRELRDIERIKGDDTDFLMAVGRFIESRLGDHPAPEVHAILSERDNLCYQPEKPHSRQLEPKRRNAILKTLRQAATACLVAGITLMAGQARANDLPDPAREAYDSARFDDAIAHWLRAAPYDELSADVLYNIGNACYRAGSPGYAALYYRRALARDSSHQESRQNLRFIERKYGSITIHRPEYQYAIARFPLSTWKGMLWTGLWLCGLAVLVFPATRSGARLRLAAVAALVAGPLLAASGALGWRYFPNDAEFAPVARQAVITADKAVLHADAARTSPEVIDAPPGSLCEVIRMSGRWAYVAFATKTRGWIPAESIEKVEPDHTPEPPRIRKPKADGKSA